MQQQLHTGNYRISDRFFRVCFFLLAALLLLFMISLVPHYGTSGDELNRYEYGKNVLYFYTGIDLGNHLEGYSVTDYYQAYGGLFDATSALWVYIFKPRDPYLLRHYYNVLFGFSGLLLAGFIAREVTGRWATALFTLLLLAVTPRYWGECFNNPKDIPFAATAMLFGFALIRWLKHISDLRWKHTLFVALAMMLVMSVRPAGLLFIVYFLLFAGGAFLKERSLRNTRFVFQVAVAFVIGFYGCALFWPQVIKLPLIAALKGFKTQSRFLVALHVLFDGQLLDCKDLPWYYPHKMLLITLPLITVAGLVCSIAFQFAGKAFLKRRYLAVVLFLAFFPLIMMVVRGTVLYDGIRQIVFLIAFLTICAAIGLETLIFAVRGRLLKTTITLIIIAGCAFPVIKMAAIHPNEYIYYNELVGGVKGAYGNYELDYYYNSARKAYDWLEEHEGANIRSSRDSLRLGSDCRKHFVFNYNATGKLPLKITDADFFTQNKSNWDYAVFFTRHLDKQELQGRYFNSPKIIHRIMADGVPVCVILKNDTDRYGYKGHVALAAGDTTTAEACWKKALARYPADNELWADLTLMYLNANRLDEARWAIDNALKISGINHNSVHLSWEIAFRKGDIAKALEVVTFATRYYKGTDAPWLRLAEAQAQSGDNAAAGYSLWKGFALDPSKTQEFIKVCRIMAANRPVAGR